MFTRPLSFALLMGFAAVAAAPPASAGSCCACITVCAPPPPIQIWGLTPSYGVNQGPVYTGPGYYTGPTYQTEVSTAGYPYSGSSDFYDAGPYADPFRNNFYHPYWPTLPGWSPRLRRHYPSRTGAIDHRGLARHALMTSMPPASKEIQAQREQ